MSGFQTSLRWAARLAALLVSCGFLLLAAGEMLGPHSAPPSTLREWTGILLLSVTCAGMMLAWRWELPGAALSLAALVAFTLLITFNRYTVHYVLATPGILFVGDWFLRKYRPPAAA